MDGNNALAGRSVSLTQECIPVMCRTQACDVGKSKLTLSKMTNFKLFPN